MPLPPGVETITVSAGDYIAQSAPFDVGAQGTVTATPSDVAIHPATGVRLTAQGRSHTVNAGATFTVVASDATGLDRQRTWTFTFNIRDGAGNDISPPPLRNVFLPKSAPTVDLDQLTVMTVDPIGPILVPAVLTVGGLTGPNITAQALATALSPFVGGGGGSGTIAPESIGSTELGPGAVTQAKLATSAVSTEKIATGAVTDTKLAAGAVTSTKIGDAQVLTAKIADAQVTEPKLATGAVTATKLGTAAVTTPKIQDGAVAPEKLDRPYQTPLPAADTGALLRYDETSASGWVALPPGPDDYVLASDTSSPTGVRWAAIGRGRSMPVTVGDGVSTEIPVTHGWGTTDVIAFAFSVADGGDMVVPVLERTPTSVVLGFDPAPAVNSIRVLLVEVA